MGEAVKDLRGAVAKEPGVVTMAEVVSPPVREALDAKPRFHDRLEGRQHVSTICGHTTTIQRPEAVMRVTVTASDGCWVLLLYHTCQYLLTKARRWTEAGGAEVVQLGRPKAVLEVVLEAA